MPLRGSAIRLSLVCVASITVAACDEKGASDPHGGNDRAPHTTAAISSAQPAGPAPLSGDILAKARAVQESAREIAKTCRWYTQSVSWEDVYYDFCVIKQPAVDKLHEAVRALLASGLVPETGPASSFAEEARMFDAFIADVARTPADNGSNFGGGQPQTRGTLSHYQDLAFAWNAMVPADKIPVDEGNTSWTLGPPDSGAPRQWERCGGLACVKRMHP